MTPEAKLELRALALQLAGLNTRAHDLVGACEEHRGGIVATDCTGCAALISVCQQIGETQQKYHFARNGAEYADAAASYETTPEEPVPPTDRSWWRRVWRRT